MYVRCSSLIAFADLRHNYMKEMKAIKPLIPYLIALLCAGFACTQDIFVVVVDWLSTLSMKLNYGWYTVVLFLLLIVWCGYFLTVNWQKYIYGSTFSATLVFFVVTTLYFRFIHDGYDFVSLVWNFTYVDILWILSVAFIIETIVNINTKKTNIEEKECAILLDSPIETPDEDKFDYYSEALHIANTLSQLPENKAVSVAVLSPWGNGKTSFVNLIKYAIKHGNNGNHIFKHVIVEFNPRQSKDITSIQEDFFKALTDAIPDEYRIRRKISDYLENIGIQDIHPLAKIITRAIRSSKKDAADDVNIALDGLGKRLVVFIDDFDRLTDAEIIEVLKLIDNNAAFRHTIFVTAYDEGAVSNALKRYESTKGIAYIDKFFTLRFHLPLRSDVSVVNTMYQILLKKVEEDIDLRSIMNKRFWIIADCAKNLREVKNFCNMFLIDYAFNTKHEINFDEYFLLELMKFRYYDDYCRLYKKEYIANQSLFPNADAKYTLKIEYSRDKRNEEPKGEMPRSIHILRCIFYDHKSWDDFGSAEKPSYRSVQYVRYFDMYFTNRGYGHVQAERLESLYSMQSNEDIDRFYRQCIQQKAQSDIVDFLRYQNWQDIPAKKALTKEETFKQFVRLVFLYSAITENNDSNIHSLQLQLIYKPNFEEKGYNSMEEQSYHNYLLSIIYEQDIIDYIPLDFLMRITHTLVSPTDDGVNDVSLFILKSDEVKQKNLELFKKYIGAQQQYTTKLSAVYRLCLERIDNSRLIITKEANDIMREFLYKDKSNEYLNGFLVYNKQNDGHISMAFKDPFFKQIFPITEEDDLFEKYVKETLPGDDINREEILAYLKRYRAAGSDHSGYYYVKKDTPSPSNMEIIEGLEF